jgi:acyl transferase domain-containing protein
VVASVGDAVEKLRAARSRNFSAEVFAGHTIESGSPEPVFLFSGNGQPGPEAFHRLYSFQPSFREAVNLCFEALEKQFESPLTRTAPGKAAPVGPDIFRVMTGGLGLFVFEYALAEMLRSWGIRPAELPGEAMGEYAAACISGALDLENALRMARGTVPKAFAPNVRREAQIRPMSAAAGDAAAPGLIFDPGRPNLQAVGPADFMESIRDLRQEGHRIIIEIGADSTLSSIGRKLMPDLLWLPCCNGGEGDWKQLLATLGRMHTEGVSINWKGFYKGRPFKKVALPTYPFQRDRYWFNRSEDLKKTKVPETSPKEIDATGSATLSEGKAGPEPSAFLLSLAEAPGHRRRDVLAEYVNEAVMRVLHRNKCKELRRDHRLMDFGIDSLMAVELRTILRNGLSLTSELPATLIYDYPTVEAIAEFLARYCGGTDKFEDEQPPPQTGPETGAPSMDGLSEAEMELLLISKLDMLDMEEQQQRDVDAQQPA